MPVSLAVVRDRIRMRLRDTDSKRPSFDALEYDQTICDAYLELQAQLPKPHLLTTSAFTISAGTDRFNLPTTVTNYSGAEYSGDVRIRLVSTGEFLTQRSVEELDALRQGQTTLALERPYCFCLWEENDLDVQGRCYPGARAAEACDLFTALTADDLRDYTAGSKMDSVSVLFSRMGAAALVHHVAADMLLRMTPSELAERRLTKDAAPLWQQKAKVLLYQEAARHHDLEDIGRTGRWVA
jgi:hypothetical protein